MTGERILLVEDSAQLRHFLADVVLPAAGYDVLTAVNGIEGFILARDLHPDLIISDYLMPQANGLDMLASLRKEALDIPFILITAEGSEALAVQALRLGVSDYLIKPFEPDDLTHAIERILKEHWTRQIAEGVPRQLMAANRHLESRLRELDTLVNVGKRVTAMLDLPHVLNEVVKAAVEITEAEEGTLLLVDEVSGELYLYASTENLGATDGSYRLPVSDSLAGQVVKSGKPMVITGEDLQKIKTHYYFRDLAYMPLLLQERVIGVLGVSNRGESTPFKAHTRQLLSVLADFAAIAIENARLYFQTEKERDTLDAILRDTEDAIIVVDTQGNVMFCNPTARKIFNTGNEPMIGKPLAQVISHNDVVELFQKEGRTGRSRLAEIAVNGGKPWLHAQLTVINDVGKVAVMQDITHLKELDRIKSEFVTSVSHDLRSPLTTILGYVDLITRTGPLNERQLEFANNVRSSVHSITTLITDLLELGKIEAGFDQDREPAQFREIVLGAVEAHRLQWESKHQRVQIDVPDDIPLILGNPLRLRQLANNLFENAVKYTPENGKVSVQLEKTPEFLVLRVEDTGIGIPKQDQPYIFDRFYRTDKAVSSFSGTGLGLSIVKSIVEQHDGRIWVDSREGEGSTFTVMLPIYSDNSNG